MNRLFVARKIALSAILVAASAGASLIAADDLPKAETILDKYVEATGGKAAYGKVHTQISTGSMEIAGMNGSMVTYQAEPDKNVTEITLQGIGKMTEGSNGTVAWANSAMQGPHIKDGAEKDYALLMGRFDSTAGWRDLFPKVQTLGAESVGGKDCYKVELTPKAGKPMTRYFDKSTGLMVKSVMTVTSPMGEVTVESTMDDYRKDGAILSPHKITNNAAGQQFTITIEKVEYNADIPASRFDLPEEIQALLNKDKK